ncbi:MAG TPA: ThiF family adenylyltransferase [Acidobacteriota bacterium]|jgi:adenylyltransferase/sulfurtransferase|nr:ThiF family adenylyltransferase [Acidobacteriota bacterium]
MPDFERYSRHVLFPGIGEEGQRRISDSVVAIVGCGALGSAQAEMLARAGVGELHMVDRDFVEWSNLQRQSLFKETDARDSIPKAVALSRELKLIDSQCRVYSEVDDFNSSNAEDFLARAELVLDATDNFQTRYLINDCSVKLGMAWIYGACVGSYGTVAPFIPGETPCLRCLFPDPPAAGEGPTCDTAGIITPLPKMVAAMQVAEVLKILVGNLQSVRRALVSFDLWANSYHTLSYSLPEPACTCCGRRQFDFLQGKQETEAITLCGRNAVQILPQRKQNVDLPALQRRLTRLGRVTICDYFLKLFIQEHELAVFRDGRAIIKGTSDPAEAKSLYARYVGD